MGVVLGQEQTDGVFERACAAVTSTPKLFLGQLCEPALHLVDPRRVGRGEVQVKAWMAHQPAVDEWGLVCAVVIQDEMHFELCWHLGVNAIQELAELRGAVAAMHLADDSWTVAI